MADRANPIINNLVQEISHVAGQLVHTRQVFDRQRQDLHRSESDIVTELLQMEDRTPRYSPDKYPEREKFLRQLRGIEKEQRQLAQRQQEQEQRLEDRLFALESRLRTLTQLDNAD